MKNIHFIRLLVIFFLISTTSFCLFACDDSNANPTEITITFDSQGGSFVPSQTIEKGGKITEPELPTKVGYTFDGWYYNDEQWSFIGYVATEDMTLKAHWTISSNNDGNGNDNSGDDSGNVNTETPFSLEINSAEYAEVANNNIQITVDEQISSYSLINTFKIGNNYTWTLHTDVSCSDYSKINSKTVSLDYGENYYFAMFKSKTNSDEIYLYSITIYRNYEQNSLNVYVKGKGTVTGSGTYDKGSNVSVIATPQSGYFFYGFFNSETNRCISSSNSYTFKLNSDVSCYAMFCEIPNKLNDIYQISKPEHYYFIKENPSLSYELTNDIDFKNFEFVTTDFVFKSIEFSGTFNGNGNVFKNISWSDGKSHPFFYSNTGNIQRLGIENINGSFVGTNSTYQSISVYRQGYIKDCYVTGTLSSGDMLGGFVYRNDGTVLNCYSCVDITITNTNTSNMGGFVVYNTGTLKNCLSFGNVYIPGRTMMNSVNLFGLNLSYDNSKPQQSLYMNGIYIGIKNENNCYVSEHAHMFVSETFNTKSSHETYEISDTYLENSAFYTSALGWESSLWDFTDLDISERKLPKLKN